MLLPVPVNKDLFNTDAVFATDASWSVCLCVSVGHNRELQKRMNRSRCLLPCGFLGPKERLHGGPYPPTGRGTFEEVDILKVTHEGGQQAAMQPARHR